MDNCPYFSLNNVGIVLEYQLTVIAVHIVKPLKIKDHSLKEQFS